MSGRRPRSVVAAPSPNRGETHGPGLPDAASPWSTSPRHTRGDPLPGFSDLGLSSGVLAAVEALGFDQPTPVQAETIPLITRGRDVIGQAQTGSGKTAAFGLPAIDHVDPSLQDVQVLVLVPTRELAIQ